MTYKHTTVLKTELVEYLNLRDGNTVIDCTFGGGGHSEEVINKLNSGTLVVFDLDDKALENTRKLNTINKKILIEAIKDNFRNLNKHCKQADAIYADLGFSTNQLENEISYKQEGDLDLRLDKSLGVSAKDLVNGMYEKELEKIFIEYSDEKLSKQIAREIVISRKKKLIENKQELRDIIKNTVLKSNIKRSQRSYSPEARIFQALRIAVNDEYSALKELLKNGFEILNTHGRLGIISFHSGEDRIVKSFMKSIVEQGLGTWIVKKLRPSEKEISENSKSHSAILRVIEKS